MGVYLKKVPPLLGFYYPKKTKDKVYLTFDDGPNENTTPLILTILKQFNAKATFFCLGENAEKFPKLIKQIVKEGHAIGNHGYKHLNGYTSLTKTYVNNVDLAKKALPETTLFRPPYGKIKPMQMWALKRHYKVVLWHIMAGDFDENISIEKCIEISEKHLAANMIYVYHDSIKCIDKVQEVLPKLLEEINRKKLTTAVIS